MSDLKRSNTHRTRISTGWCMEDQHDLCAEFYLTRAYSRGCICPCHGLDVPTELEEAA